MSIPGWVGKVLYGIPVDQEISNFQGPEDQRSQGQYFEMHIEGRPTRSLTQSLRMKR